MKSFSAIFLFVFFAYSYLFAQGDIDEQDEYFYQDERTWSGHIRNDGLGISCRYAKRIDGYKKTTYLFQFDYIKDEKEKRVTTTSSYKTFVYGKLNYFYSLKGGIGLQKEIYSKHDVGSISIRYFYNVGLSVGILKPIYYEVIDAASPETSVMKFKESTHLSISQFNGKAPYLTGIKETTLMPGAYGKFGFTFEYSKQHTKFNAIEIGFLFDAYAKRIPIMYSEDPDKYQFFFPSIYLALRFGKIIDSQFKNNKTKLDRILSE